MSTASATALAPTHEEIALRAYELWLERGCPDGSPEQDWFQAETEVIATLNQFERPGIDDLLTS